MRNGIGGIGGAARNEPAPRKRHGWRVLRWVLPICPLLVWTACSDGPTAPGIGAIRVSIVTTGGDRDDDGYVIAIGNDRWEQTGDGARILQEFGSGTHSVALEEVADNCSVSGANPRSVTVAPGAMADVDFVVVCDATGVAVTTVTSGPDVPPPFQVLIGDLAPASVLSNGTTVIGRLAPGTYTVQLTGIIEGCTVQGDSEVTVTVTPRAVTPVTFAVACNALTGVVRVTISTSGEDPDPNGYTVATTGGWQTPAPANGVVTFQPMLVGTHVIALSGLASNCTAVSGSERTVTVIIGGATRDTVNTRFDVSCVRAQKIAFAANGAIVVVYADGTNPVVVASGHGPSWSPDGTRLVYSTLDCYYGYWCSGGLQILDFGSGQTNVVPNGAGGSSPSWSPDGERIAFIYTASDGRSQLAVISTGDALPPLLPVASGLLAEWAWPSSPSWSPDGQRIVFGCTVTGTNTDDITDDICAVNRNGTDFQRLTNGEGNNWDPAWSPDGSRIAFATTPFGGGPSEIALMNPDGSGVTRLVPGFTPTWTPNGQILFSSANGVHVVNPDGSGLTRLFTANTYDLAWRP